ncbi:MAG: LAGLIDADG family homing endonuclease [Candidatus Omnitrophica bacterium]|nr:LAGLIDADG family homing endonuclease [Candidatus Omnitrophota bacterium]
MHNKIYTPELAYAIGLLTTDGNLSPDNRHITLTSSDKQLLKTFKKCLSLNNKISRNPKGGFSKKQSYKIQFGDISLYKWLIKIGLSQNKTFHLKKITIPDLYFRDFLRGHLDGDGSIVTYEDKYNVFKSPKYVYKRLYTHFISSSPPHIKWIAQKLSSILAIKGDLSCDRRIGYNGREKCLWRLRFAKNDSLKLLSWLYYKPDLPCLKRKRKIAERFINLKNR